MDRYMKGTVHWSVNQDVIRVYYQRSSVLPSTPSNSTTSLTFTSGTSTFNWLVDGSTPIGATAAAGDLGYTINSGPSGTGTGSAGNGTWLLDQDPGGSGNLYQIHVRWISVLGYGVGGTSAWNTTSPATIITPPALISSAFSSGYGGITADKTGYVQHIGALREFNGRVYGSFVAGDENVEGSFRCSLSAYTNGAALPFTGAHEGIIGKTVILEEGDILIDNGVSHHKDINNTISEVKVSSTPNQKGSVGIFTKRELVFNETRFPETMGTVGIGGFEGKTETSMGTPIQIRTLYSKHEHYIDTHDTCVFNSLGEGLMNVCGESGDLEVGDLIVSSSIPGKGMKQDDDIIRSYTVAKVRENVTFSDPTEVKLVACIYLCG
jgi:hypothetical protein